MCDYCGCRDAGPTAELAREHESLLAASDRIEDLIDDIPTHIAAHISLATVGADTDTGMETDTDGIIAAFAAALERHAEREDLGIFERAAANPLLAERVEALVGEHAELRRLIGPYSTVGQLQAGFRLLRTHIEDEEYDLFPHIFHMFDPEDWDEVELAHRAVDAAWAIDPE